MYTAPWISGISSHMHEICWGKTCIEVQRCCIPCRGKTQICSCDSLIPCMCDRTKPSDPWWCYWDKFEHVVQKYEEEKKEATGCTTAFTMLVMHFQRKWFLSLRVWIFTSDCGDNPAGVQREFADYPLWLPSDEVLPCQGSVEWSFGSCSTALMWHSAPCDQVFFLIQQASVSVAEGSCLSL